MGNFGSTGSRVSGNGEPAVLGHLNGGSDDNLKENDAKMENVVNDSGPIDDCVMSEASSLVNSKERDNFEEEEEFEDEDEEEFEDVDEDEEEEIDDEDEDEDEEEEEEENDDEVEEEEANDDEDEEEEEENGFQVGDFVWVEEVNCHKWWPGKVYDSSDASDLALKQIERGRLLVAYSGDEKNFAWCNPSQLKPFLDNFKEFSKTSGSRGFLRAVEEAVREIGEHVEHLLVCDKAALVSTTPVAVNSGIRRGVLVPSVRREIVCSLVLEKPGIVLEDVKSLAVTVGFSDLVETEVLRRKISALYWRRGRFGLAEFGEEGYIIGLEDREDEVLDKSSCQVRSLRKCSVMIASKKRKFGDEVSKVDVDDVATTGSTNLRRRLSEVSKIENGDMKQVEEVSNGKSRKRKNRKCVDDDDDGVERREESNDSNHLEESEKKEEIAIDLLTPLASLCKRVKVEVSPVAEMNSGSGESLMQTGKRERKKSKYLSPEYMTDFGLRGRRIKIESESSQIKVTERMTKNTDEKVINLVRFGATPEEMLKLIREAALGTEYFEEDNSSSEMIREFVSIYRSFTYHDGANSNIHKRNISDEEKQQTRNEEMEKRKREDEKGISGVEVFIKTEEDETGGREGVMEIECLKEKLEEMRGLLDQSEGEITEELKRKLVDGSRNLLDKVSKMIVRSS
ncbi:unnamed protein product [Microthlaspi erraticum]|uniref:PWWP domain-containing protein n=1 Tax=Microthlaspi erraticum TaxID=1685480 RepID=A0A6D2KAQ7_9BRAS|nr:unnamed protein product [Microthlaspi erraticum]